MSSDIIIILVCCALGLLAHASRHQHWISWILRIIIGIFCGAELLSALLGSLMERNNQWEIAILAGLGVSTLLILFKPLRQWLSLVLTWINQVISGQVFILTARKTSFSAAISADSIFIANSMPHLMGLWIYITTMGFLLSSIDPSGMKLPMLPIPLPVPLDQLFAYNGLGLVALAVCGIGIFITRKPMECLQRLALVKPSWKQVGIGVGLIAMTFAYDYIWSLFTHQMGPDLASKMSSYNSGTFTAGGGAGSSLILALATGLFAGIGEETLMRGALLPVLGILPAAILHGALHGQFSHAPIFIIQVVGWSAIMGIVRRYTNTTTTIIGHAGFNFVTTFLFAFNP